MKSIKLPHAQDLATYEPSKGLIKAGEMAFVLGRPLLLSGKPGTGKTQYAHWLAADKEKEGFNPKPFVFSTKSTSVYSELFYNYDAVSHFRNKSENKSASDFIELTALGKAIICAKGLNTISGELRRIAERSIPIDHKHASIVLIDEIDKAPRDFPNDLLHEIENLSFTIKEISSEPIVLTDQEKEKIAVILTSNFEKGLPDAFLRRCLFYHIEFPHKQELMEIVMRKISMSKQDTELVKQLDDKLSMFETIYNYDNIQKKPGTSECIDWINWLFKNKLLGKPFADIEHSLVILLKNEADQKNIRSLFS